MKIKVKYLFLSIIIFLICTYFGTLIKCEVLTSIHYDEFENAYKQNTMLGEMEDFKVLNYSSDKSARVYYISEGNSMGNVLTFEYVDGEWKEISWDTRWSKMGNADNLVYPYWWHFKYFIYMEGD